MTDHPVNSVFIDGTPNSKADDRSYFKDRVRLRVTSASEVASKDYSDAFGLDLGGLLYDRDTGDTTTQHNGTTCLVDSTGARFKLIGTGIGKRVSVRVATTANITIATALNDGDTLNGVTLATADLVLVKDQTDKSENGIIVVGTTPARAADFDQYDDYVGLQVAVQEGTTDANTLWFCSANLGGVIDTDDIVFTRIAFVASGDVNGPSSATDGRIAVFNGGTGKLIKDSGTLLSELTNTSHLINQPDPFPSISVKPSFWCNFETMPWLEAGWSFARSTTAPYMDRLGSRQTAAINAPRFHYDWALKRGGLLLWPGGTNLILRSEDFDNAVWNKTRATINSNALIAPNGTLTADEIVSTTDVGTHRVHQIVSATNGVTYCDSVFVKKIAGFSSIQLVYQDGDTNLCVSNALNLDTLTWVGSATASGTTTYVDRGFDAYPNGWYRVWMAYTVGADAASTYRVFYASGGTNVVTDKMGLWGAQSETGSTPSPYIPTASAQVTVGADSLLMDVAGLIRQGEGTIFIEATPMALPGGGTFFQIYKDANNNVRFVGGVSSKPQLRCDVRNAGTNVAAAASSSVLSIGTRFRSAARYATDDFSIVSNGTLGAPDTSGAVPTDLATLVFGNQPMLVHKIGYLPRAVSDVDLAVMAPAP